MESKLIKYVSLFFFISISCPIAFCSGWNDYSAQLPNGYELVRTNAPSIFIFRPYSANGMVVENSCVVPPKIVGLDVYGHIVFGETEDSPGADDWGPGAPGFFILDTKNHKVQLGLDKDAWLSSLKAFGVSKKPSLRSPGSFRKLTDWVAVVIGSLLTLAVFVSVVLGPMLLKRPLILLCIILGMTIIWFLWHKFHRRRKLSNKSCDGPHPAEL